MNIVENTLNDFFFWEIHSVFSLCSPMKNILHSFSGKTVLSDLHHIFIKKDYLPRKRMWENICMWEKYLHLVLQLNWYLKSVLNYGAEIIFPKGFSEMAPVFSRPQEALVPYIVSALGTLMETFCLFEFALDFILWNLSFTIPIVVTLERKWYVFGLSSPRNRYWHKDLSANNLDGYLGKHNWVWASERGEWRRSMKGLLSIQLPLWVTGELWGIIWKIPQVS